MSLKKIQVQPTAETTHYRVSVRLDGALYRFRFYTNAADDGWCFDVSNEDESASVAGLALVAGVDLLEPYRHLDLPPGSLFVEDESGGDPDELAFVEGRATLYYLEAA